MSGGIISGNTAAITGGGVYIDFWEIGFGRFRKTGGIIYGYAGETISNRNTAIAGITHNNNGHAVFLGTPGRRRKETTSGPFNNLDSTSSAGWDFSL
jgi:hypothetical protein